MLVKEQPDSSAVEFRPEVPVVQEVEHQIPEPELELPTTASEESETADSSESNLWSLEWDFYGLAAVIVGATILQSLKHFFHSPEPGEPRTLIDPLVPQALLCAVMMACVGAVTSVIRIVWNFLFK